MAAPVRITFRDIPPSPAISSYLERRADKLETFFDRIVSCHVVVEEPHRSHHQGKKFHVRISMLVPEKELVVSKTPDDRQENLYAAIDKAFDDAERVLEDYARQLKPDTKTHLKPLHGVVGKIFHQRGYGFIEADDDRREVYFHRNSVLDEKFDRIEVGAKVRFAEEDGDKGPQASSVHVVRASGPSVSRAN